MATTSVAVEKVKSFWNSQVHNEEKWAMNMVPFFLFYPFPCFLYHSFNNMYSLLILVYSEIVCNELGLLCLV